MIESTSQAFLDILDPAKDKLFNLARAAGPNHAELCLQRCARDVFEQFHNQVVGPADVISRIEAQIQASQTSSASPATDTVPMPAAVWARMVAAVQIDAARLGGVAEQSMLDYDPLLAPQKKKPNDEGAEGLNLSPWSRFVIAAAIVLTVGIAASIILTTRHSPPTDQTKPSTSTRPRSPAHSSGTKLPTIEPTTIPAAQKTLKASAPS